jgi:hypothetical protein
MSFYRAKDGYVEKRSYPWNIGISGALNLTKIEIVDAPMRPTKASIAKSAVPFNVKFVRSIKLATRTLKKGQKNFPRLTSVKLRLRKYISGQILLNYVGKTLFLDQYLQN